MLNNEILTSRTGPPFTGMCRLAPWNPQPAKSKIKRSGFVRRSVDGTIGAFTLISIVRPFGCGLMLTLETIATGAVGGLAGGGLAGGGLAGTSIPPVCAPRQHS